MKTEPRYMLPASVCIGDVIRVAWSDGIRDWAITARVASRQHVGRLTELNAEDGSTLVSYVSLPDERFPLGQTAPVKATVTLIERSAKDISSVMLDFELEDA